MEKSIVLIYNLSLPFTITIEYWINCKKWWVGFSNIHKVFQTNINPIDNLNVF